MDLATLEQRLLAAARAHPPSQAVPYAFEERVLAKLRGRPPLDAWAWWSSVLWRAAVSSLGVVLLLGVLTLTADLSGSDSDTLYTELEAVVYAAADSNGD